MLQFMERKEREYNSNCKERLKHKPHLTLIKNASEYEFNKAIEEEQKRPYNLPIEFHYNEPERI